MRVCSLVSRGPEETKGFDFSLSGLRPLSSERSLEACESGDEREDEGLRGGVGSPVSTLRLTKGFQARLTGSLCRAANWAKKSGLGGRSGLCLGRVSYRCSSSFSSPVELFST